MVHQPKERDASVAGAPQVTIGPIKRFGRYTLVKKLATGGMAEIWLARQTGLAGFNRFVVIKKILSHLGEEETFVKMFLDEARMSVQLTHPNIVQVYDLGEAEGTYFIAMEFISGENLAAIAWRGVKRKSPLSPAFAARIIADSCKALHYAHHLRGPDGKMMEIVHRDISPQNILVTYEGEVKVVDFGIAKAASKSQHTKTGMLKGKFSYMSPEQCLGNSVDKRSDIFALGIVLYELATGKRLFKHESELMILEMITKRRITPPSQVAENISPGLEAIILKALDKTVETRYQTAQDLQIALEDYLRGEAEAASNNDIASYMRSLFTDKIDEKRAICEMASREDYGGAAFDEEATEQALPHHYARAPTTGGPPRAVLGRTGQMSATSGMPQSRSSMGSLPGQGHPGMGTPNGQPQYFDPRMTGAQGMMPGPNGQMQRFTMGSYPPQSQSQMMPGMAFASASGALPVGAVTEDRSWLPRVVIVVAVFIILIAGAYLVWEILHGQDPQPQAPQVGKLVIESSPAGAQIYVNGQPVKLENGEIARTPIEQLANLAYGTRYNIALVLEGYKTYQQEIVMDELNDGKPIRPTLEQLPSKLTIKIDDPDARDVRLYLNNNDFGLGPKADMVVPAGKVSINAVLTGKYCESVPNNFVLGRGETKEVVTRCREAGRGGGGAMAGGGGGGGAPRRFTGGGGARPAAAAPSSAQAAPAPQGDCSAPTGLTGLVTINTKPFSEIWFEGKKLGETPLAHVKLPSGCWEIKAVSPETKKEKKVKIEVQPNKNLRYQFEVQ